MKNQWTNKYKGYVKVKAYGRGIERLINTLTKQGIPIWNVRRSGTDEILFLMEFREISRLRQAVRKSDCKVKFEGGFGGPFFLKRMRKNSGFVAGLFAFLFCIFMLSNMVWGIQIHNAKPQTEHAIRKELDRMGVKIGKVQFFVDDPETIQRKLSDRISALTWVGVELKGTTFHFQVVEKKQPKAVKKTSPQNLIASKKAVITYMFVEKGQSMVKVHDYVGKGQLLVSGFIGNPESPKIVPAKGVIMGETWYRATAEVPLATKFSVYNGDENVRHYLKLWNMSIPVWGFKNPGYKKYVEEETVKPFHFLQWELPFSYKVKTKRSKEEITRIYTEKEAVAKAMADAKKHLEKKLPDDARITGEKILHESIENGKVKLSIHYQVIENIAAGQPIIQGD
ncbi:sporulation protein YqfD [Peribacillus sp. B-H-3]|uniref:sporulation protein YqfD n=1 Tax=Peribacillus sp. B-H-3 TaxID=3400420 RepID=UPI003B01451B